ncbi:hypothetical protein ACFL2Q_05645 [Thermodesulfobacteriota bacterium]
MRARPNIISVILLAICLVIFSRGPLSAQGSFQLTPAARFLLGMEGNYMWVLGNMLIPSGGRPGSGSRVGFSELGLEPTEGFSAFLRASILEDHLFSFDYLAFSPSGERRITRTFRFHNKTYEKGSLVESRLDFNWLRFSYGYQVVNVPGWTVAPKIGVHHVRNAITLNGETKEAELFTNTRRLDGTYPVLGVETRLLFPLGLHLSLEMEGIHLITRGFLTFFQLGAIWEVIPDMAFTLAVSNRTMHFLENNQPLNNEWFCSAFAVTSGVGFTF